MSYFQSGGAAPAPAPAPAKVDTSVTKSGEDVTVPYLDYRVEVGKPFSVDYFELGETWNDVEGSFAPEVEAVESYLKGMIESGRMDNSLDSVKERLKQIEKAVGSPKSERTVVKIGKIAEYCKFLEKSDHIEDQARKYGRT